jgi:CheY-like chemotaxis protein
MTKILHIDDDKAFLASTKTMFEQKGIDIYGVTNGGEAVQTLKEYEHYYDYDLVIIDLAMPDLDGIKVYEEIRKINPKIPIFIASAHFGEINWERKLKPIEGDIKRIEKPFPIVVSKDFKKIETLIRTERDRYKKELYGPFVYSLVEFMKLSEEAMDKVFEDAFEIHFPFVNIYFEQNSEIDWVIIANSAGNIISFGKREDEPDETELNTIAEKFDVPIFTYSRPKDVEEMQCTWSHKPSKSNPDDYYPTVLFEFDKPPGEILYCDFDTGSFYSFISYEELMGKHIIKRKIWNIGSAILWSGPYRYYNDTVTCRLVGSSKKVDVRLKYQAVKKWINSPLVKNYKNRIGLIGREMLLDNRVKLVLNGRQKETDILYP